MLNVKLTPAYTLVSDDKALNFIVRERRIVDPTKAPGYKAIAGAEAPPMSEKYVDVAYYPVNTEGLRAALDYVRFKAAVSVDTTTLAEFMAVLQTETLSIEAALDSRLPYWPDVTVEIAEKKRAISPEDAA
ncbi:hypothetical protein [Paenibacillus sp. Marseille-Q9583]